MKRTMIALLLLAAAGCKSNEPASNAATEYTDNMQSNVGQAQDAAAAANSAVAESQGQASEAASQQ